MLVIGVCEDQPEERKKISELICEYGKAHHLEMELYEYESGYAFWQAYEPGKLNILFLDIYLKDSTGIEIARKLREEGEKSDLIFLTSSPDHAIEGFELSARHYLIKPATAEKIDQALSRCETKFNNRFLEIESDRLKHRVYLDQIRYIEVFDKVSIIHTVKQDIKTYLALSKLERELGGQPFLRCHRCTIVNMDYIKDYTATDFIMDDQTPVAIHKKGSTETRQIYLDYLFSQMRENSLGQ
ncbi:LytTR family DNA-binding domain-containing protein [Eubacteriaceae bacterium ES2]|nr:LytTR family DNA-binding domain-containing protein [Eubacteriaceae bacterium ES2]